MSQSGVFKSFVNSRAFVDRAIFSVWGTKRERILPSIHVIRNKPIGGPKRFYSRCEEGVHTPTGNPVELRYGRLKRFDSLPPYRLDLRSHKVPLTGAQVAHVAGAFFRAGFRGYFAQLELTMDTKGFSPADFSRHLFTRARRISERNGYNGRNTLYIGGPHSRWQARVYLKTSHVTRVEFILRRAFLQSSGIVQAHDALVLRKFNPATLASWKKFDREKLEKAVVSVQPRWKRRFYLDWPPYLTVQMLAQTLKDGWHVQSPLMPTDAELLLRKMVRRFLW